MRMDRTLIQTHTSGIIKGLIERSQSIAGMEHKLLKGELREIFVSNLIKNFLPSNFEVGSGVIVNQKGDQSSQIDVLIYDKSFLPPFIKESNLGVYPAESVLAIIEVRSRLDKTDLTEMNEKANKIFTEIYDPNGSLYPEYPMFQPYFTVFGFYSQVKYTQDKKEELRNWIWDNCKQTRAICLLDGYSWFNLGRAKGANHLKLRDENNEETKSFFCLILDNIVSVVKRRDFVIAQHRDYFGIYIRDQSGIREIFDSR